MHVLDRPGPAPDRTLHYDPRPAAVVEVFDPPHASAGLAILLHGGFWRAAYDRTYLRGMAAALAAQNGIMVALPEYRRVGEPGGGIPGTLADVAEILQRVPGLLGAAESDVVVAGHSAGGHLALVVAADIPRPPRRVVSLAGVLDLAAAHDARLSNGAVAALLGESEPSEAQVAAIDPLRRAVPPCEIVLLHGDRDDEVPVAYSRAYRRKAPDAELIVLPGADHYDVIDPRSEVFSRVASAIATSPLNPEVGGSFNDHVGER
ncbi:alpha/beta hydrolase [Microbacterium sp. 67-17]|uniref:alpha/beta hydrolase n=1 Tax=Microbacterium sp. 67-17 TaxID=1895782 RepID=UPI000A8A116B|nr:alpha/beta hydrolase [Microbacterium sp. 67-17]